MSNVYWDERRMSDDNVFPSILAIGDSWFWYPFPGGSLINALGPMVAPKGHNVLTLGNNGAEAFDYVNGVYKRQVKTALKHHGTALSAVLVSGGGNDFAGFNDLRPLLKLDCSNAQTPAECFEPGDEEGTLDWLMKKTLESLGLLIWRVFAEVPVSSPVFLHNYDYARPDGRGVFGASGWLKPALDDAKVPLPLQEGCIQLIIDRFTSMLETVASGSNRVVLIDSRGTLADTDWANELHPKPKGFRKLARQKWLPKLREKGLAN